MGTYSTKDFEAALERIGFRRDTTHHNTFWYYDSEKKSSLHTRTSHGEKEFGNSMPSMRRRQIGNLSRRYRHLVEQGIVQNVDVDQEDQPWSLSSRSG